MSEPTTARLPDPLGLSIHDTPCAFTPENPVARGAPKARATTTSRPRIGAPTGSSAVPASGTCAFTDGPSVMSGLATWTTDRAVRARLETAIASARARGILAVEIGGSRASMTSHRPRQRALDSASRMSTNPRWGPFEGDFGKGRGERDSRCPRHRSRVSSRDPVLKAAAFAVWLPKRDPVRVYGHWGRRPPPPPDDGVLTARLILRRASSR